MNKLCALIVLGGLITLVASDDEEISSFSITSVDKNSQKLENLEAHHRAKRTYLNSGEIREVRDYHNYLRRRQGSSNMMRLDWSPKLAEMAHLWASRCVFEHGQPSGYDTSGLPYTFIGQNLYGSTSSGTLVVNGTAAVQGWYNEIRYYDRSGPCTSGAVCGTCTAPTGRTCGHYTQVVWAKSYQIGCAYAICNRLSGSGFSTPSIYYICNYGPSGNFLNEYPYQEGPACSDCDPVLHQCDDGLCYIVAAPVVATVEPTIAAAQATTAAMPPATTAAPEATTAPAPITTAPPAPATTAPPAPATTAAPEPVTTAPSAPVTTAVPESVTTAPPAPATTAVPDQVTTAEAPTTPAVEVTTMPELTTPAVVDTTATTDTCDAIVNGTLTCPNTCEQYGKDCCGCEILADYRQCYCCPRGYFCCGTTGGCCPTGTTCTAMGTCEVIQYVNAVAPVDIRAPPCEEARPDELLFISCTGRLDQLYFDGRRVPYTALPYRNDPNRFDVIHLAGSVRLIAIRGIDFGYSGGILTRSSGGTVSGRSSWRCAYFGGRPPLNWYSPTYDDSRWSYASVYYREGIVYPGYPYYSIAPRYHRIPWFWSNLSPYRSGWYREAFCRLTLGQI